jgi:hypothetical protein
MPHPIGLAVPIIGQTITVHPSWTCVVPVTCHCDPRPTFLVAIHTVAACPSCRKAYTIGKVDFDLQTGRGGIQVIQVLDPLEKAAS